MSHLLCWCTAAHCSDQHAHCNVNSHSSCFWINQTFTSMKCQVSFTSYEYSKPDKVTHSLSKELWQKERAKQVRRPPGTVIFNVGHQICGQTFLSKQFFKDRRVIDDLGSTLGAPGAWCLVVVKGSWVSHVKLQNSSSAHRSLDGWFTNAMTGRCKVRGLLFVQFDLCVLNPKLQDVSSL